MGLRKGWVVLLSCVGCFCCMIDAVTFGGLFTFDWKSWITGMPSNIPADLKEMTAEEIRKYDGTKPGLPTYIAFNGLVFDVSKDASLFSVAAGGHYGMYAGHDCTRAILAGSIDPKDLDKNLKGLSEDDADELLPWTKRWAQAYPIVGKCAAHTLLPDIPPPPAGGGFFG